MRFIFRTDVHLADNAPSSWKGDYQGEILSCLAQVGEICKEAPTLAVLDGGDYFHAKSPTKNSHSLIVKTVQVHKEYPCPVFGIVGNHDLTYNSMDTLDKQPLGVLFSTGVFNQLQDEVFVSNGLKVRVVGFSYSTTRAAVDFRIPRKDEDILVFIVHALACENPNPGQVQMFSEPVFGYSDFVFEGGPDLVLFGHWHKNQGITRVGKQTFVNLGSLSRGALNQDNLERIPSVAVIEIDTDGVRVEAREMKVLPASEVFDLDVKVRLDAEVSEVETFVQRMREGLFTRNDAPVEEIVQGLQFAGDVRDAALEYLEKARMV